MLGVSGLISGSGDAAAAEAAESGGAAADLGGEAGSLPPSAFGEAARLEEGERNSGGNRWPRQETLALLKIRWDMDVVFRDSSLKGPLWEEVSRKMAELGYHRNAKKCKEKFENVYKYHKRTREGRATKADGKTYRFFDQLEAFEQSPAALPPPPPRQLLPAPPPPPPSQQLQVSSSTANSNANNPPAQVTVPSAQNPFGVQNPVSSPTFPQARSVPPNNAGVGFPAHPGSPFSDSTWSSTSSDEDAQRRHRRKRKWKDFFERLMKDVIEKQEELQKKFLEALEKRERDRMVREEAWRVQEMARMKREHDLLLQERSMSAAKDAAVLQFLQKVSEHHNLEIPLPVTNSTPPPPPPQGQQPESISTPTQPHPPPPQSQQPPAPGPEPISVAPPATAPFLISSPTTPSVKQDDSNAMTVMESYAPASSSRWPKTEVQALITLRTNLDTKYQESGPKGPLWEEISAGMKRLGYNRNPKRCKEKWENINKYFKKVKESNKRRPEDSKTCPYFHLLDAIYKEKAMGSPGGGSSAAFKPENTQMVPIMAQPEQQWPQPEHRHPQQQQHESDHMDEDGEDDEDDYDDEDGGGYEIVTNKPQQQQHHQHPAATGTA